ncbi:hypothetical protein D9M68_938590 [compost metagenome]
MHTGEGIGAQAVAVNRDNPTDFVIVLAAAEDVANTIFEAARAFSEDLSDHFVSPRLAAEIFMT